jgi:hypothetical protein
MCAMSSDHWIPAWAGLAPCWPELSPALAFPLEISSRFLIIRRLGVLAPISVTLILE